MMCTFSFPSAEAALRNTWEPGGLSTTVVIPPGAHVELAPKLSRAWWVIQELGDVITEPTGYNIFRPLGRHCKQKSGCCCEHAHSRDQQDVTWFFFPHVESP